MSVYFIEDYEFFKNFGMKNFTFDQSLKNINDINDNYNRNLQLLHDSSTANNEMMTNQTHQLLKQLNSIKYKIFCISILFNVAKSFE